MMEAILLKWAAETNPTLLIQNIVFLVVATFALRLPATWFLNQVVKKMIAPIEAHLKSIEGKFDELTQVVERGFKTGDARMGAIEKTQNEIEKRVERLENNN